MEPNTHRALNGELCGLPRALKVGSAEVDLVTTRAMCADEQGLVHGGFVFGLADHAAMLAINQPNVVLGSADVRFLAPVTLGEQLRAYARLAGVEGKRHRVEVQVKRGEQSVFEGTFVCVVPARHVLEALRGAAT
jgi:acyl-coenzyme A thioesterase PaaI-like protein